MIRFLAALIRRPLSSWGGAVLLVLTTASAGAASSAGRHELDLSGAGWRLWLDREAAWQDDTLHFPTPAIETLPQREPTRGWSVLTDAGVPVSVPGTVEEYLQTTPGPDGDITGVSWWYRAVELPADAATRRLILRFESLRERAEIFVNRQLVGYDVVGSTPVEVDITAAVAGRPQAELAVRVTDPGGNFDWRDSRPLRWGSYVLPLSHGFGGITGRVQLIVCDAVWTSDLWMENTPAITEANAHITVRNDTGVPQRRSVAVRVSARPAPDRTVFEQRLPEAEFAPGETSLTVKISAPGAKLWQLDDPRLHVCEVALLEAGAVRDTARRTFGFRWFAPEGFGENAVFRLNGRRIVLRSAISWGFWPINGILPTEELAEKQVRAAKAMGLNMLNFHRAIGNPIVLEKADELGLLYYEEPGAYKSVGADPFGREIVREKWLRMVRRDRSHPSLVIYNLINEWDSRNPHPNPAEIARHREDMAAARALDPSRVITHTSAWARGEEIDDPAKLHFRPFDTTPHWNGWYDVHHAGGPATWNDGLYRSPDDYYGRTENRREIVFWGEEGALSTPLRIELISEALAAAPRLGWDGAGYQAWYRSFAEFFERKQLQGTFPSVDAFTSALGAVSLYHQGRKIEAMRMSDVADGYAVNGWEAELIENHSGIVDCFRNPKSDPAILAYYNQPAYVAVKVRNTVVTPPAAVQVDLFTINEIDAHGPHELRVGLRDPSGREFDRWSGRVALRGGETFGELLAENVKLAIPAGVAGMCRVEAELVAPDGKPVMTGRDEVFAVDWRSDRLSGAGAVWESGEVIQRFLQRDKDCSAAAFRADAGRLDWIVAARGPLEGEPMPVPEGVLAQPQQGAGLETTFFADQKFAQPVHRRIDARVNLVVDDGAAPDPALAVMTNYGVRWAGRLTPRRDGRTTFVVRSSGRVRLIVAGETVIAPARPRAIQEESGSMVLKAGVPVPFQLDFMAGAGVAQCELMWVPPDDDVSLAAKVLERVQRDGTTLVILERADAWMTLLAREPGTPIKYGGSFRVGKAWLGGVHFVRAHPLFRGLPVDGAMDWPYQSVVRNGNDRMGLVLDGEELAAGCYHSYPLQLGTVAGVFPLGRGHVVFSTLDVVSHLDAPAGPGDVAKKILGNCLIHADELAERARAAAH